MLLGKDIKGLNVLFVIGAIACVGFMLASGLVNSINPYDWAVRPQRDDITKNLEAETDGITEELSDEDVDVDVSEDSDSEPTEEETAEAKKKPSKKKGKQASIKTLDGVGKKAESVLLAAGFDTIEKIASTTAGDLVKLEGIGKKTAEKIINSAKSKTATGGESIKE